MTHKVEELQHDVSKLRDLLSQRVTKNELEDKMDGLETKMKRTHGRFEV